MQRRKKELATERLRANVQKRFNLNKAIGKKYVSRIHMQDS